MTTTQEADSKAIFRRAMEATNSHDWELISKTFEELFAPDVVLHNPVPTRVKGLDAVKEVFSSLHAAFPDLRVDIDDLIVERDKVVGRQTVSGTNLGDFMGRPATGKPVSYEEIFIFRIAGGRIAEIWGVVDVLSQLRQLGSIP